MIDMLIPFYSWFLAFHIIAVMFWMASLYYLPRLFVYHCEAKPSSPQTKMLEIMEWRLLKIIATPSMLAAWLFGLILLSLISWAHYWLWIKIGLVLALSGFHGACAVWMKTLARGNHHYSSGFFRMVNELPPLLTIIIVILVVVKPF